MFEGYIKRRDDDGIDDFDDVVVVFMLVRFFLLLCVNMLWVVVGYGLRGVDLFFGERYVGDWFFGVGRVL